MLKSADIQAVTGLSTALKEQNQHLVPEDWFVLICDIQNSTDAIRNGKYKNVNLVSAATIMGINNALSGETVPYQFGGDGATFLVNPEQLPKAEQALVGCKRLARENFNLNLRIGKVAIKELIQSGYPVFLSYIKISDHLSQPMFSGEGIQFAEKLVKDKSSSKQYEITETENAIVNTEGVECRWEPIPSSKGQMLSLIVTSQNKNRHGSSSLYQTVLQEIEAIYPQLNPVSVNRLKLTNKFSSYLLESSTRISGNFTKYFDSLINIIRTSLAGVLWKTVLKKSGQRYYDEVVGQSDYQKFDGSLRMILDSHADQTARLEKFLTMKEMQGEIFFGIHKSSHALMTCLIFNRAAGDHLHLIDGADGGYALAASQIKEKIKNSSNEKKKAS